MILLQLFSVAFGLAMLYWSFITYKKRLIFIKELAFWSLVWLIFVVVTLLPESTNVVLQTFKISRMMDLYMIVAFIVLWLVAYRNYIENRIIKRKLQDLVRQAAITEAMGKRLDRKKRKTKK